MTKQQIIDEIIQIAVEYSGTIPEEILHSTHLQEDLYMDSLERVEFSMKCEQLLKVNITDKEYKQLHTIGDYVEIIWRKKNPLIKTSMLHT